MRSIRKTSIHAHVYTKFRTMSEQAPILIKRSSAFYVLPQYTPWQQNVQTTSIIRHQVNKKFN